MCPVYGNRLNPYYHIRLITQMLKSGCTCTVAALRTVMSPSAYPIVDKRRLKKYTKMEKKLTKKVSSRLLSPQEVHITARNAAMQSTPTFHHFCCKSHDGRVGIAPIKSVFALHGVNPLYDTY
uniref:SFRICE_034247 n=1 Tax=Spodoptera frugiperda TaxID=7108 RepID=A0A2H1WNI9_SPOFR